MYAQNDKRRLYQIIGMYIDRTITASAFCDDFYYSYSLEISDDCLTDIEKKAFSELDKVASRFSKYKEDHQLDPKAFSTETELLQIVIETKNKLKGQNPI